MSSTAFAFVSCSASSDKHSEAGNCLDFATQFFLSEVGIATIELAEETENPRISPHPVHHFSKTQSVLKRTRRTKLSYGRLESGMKEYLRILKTLRFLNHSFTVSAYPSQIRGGDDEPNKK
jgi:hypothetical protein